MHVATNTDDPKPFHPYCKDCGWRMGGVDSWDGKACKCGHSEAPIRRVAAHNGPVMSPTGNQSAHHPDQTTK